MKARSQRPSVTVGYQLTFFTHQDHRHHGRSLGQWLVEEARRMGIGGATLIAASEGFGNHRHLHQRHLVSFPDQPLGLGAVAPGPEAEAVEGGRGGTQGAGEAVVSSQERPAHGRIVRSPSTAYPEGQRRDWTSHSI